MEGSFKLTRISGKSSRIQVQWTGAEITSHEVRPLLFNKTEVDPAAIISAFEKASTEEGLETIGSALWNCLAGGSAGSARRSALARKDPADTFRTLLDLTDAPDEWQALPWEAVSEGEGSEPLSLRPSEPIVRFSERRLGRTQAAQGWPIRIMIICGESESGNIQVKEELEAIEDGLWERRREIIVQVLDLPNEVTFKKQFREFQPHILHFIGHGDGEGVTINATENAWSLKPANLRNLMSGESLQVPNLVFLNACRSQSPGTSKQMTPADCRSLANVFLLNGVVAFVGMSGDIEGKASVVLSKYFYEEWLKGKPLDQAIVSAREHISTQFRGAPRLHLLPCLTVAAPPTKWITWAPVSKSNNGGFGCTPLEDMHRTFVDRNDVRRQIFASWLVKNDRWHDQPNGIQIVVVRGGDKSGKTDAVRLVLKAMHAKGWIARWQEMKDPSINWLKALTRFTDGTNNCGPLSAALPKDEFALFTTMVGGLSDINGADDIAEAFKLWREGLLATARRFPVALAIDSILIGAPFKAGGEFFLPEYLKHLTSQLLAPLSQLESDHPVLVILVMNDDEADAYIPLINRELRTCPDVVKVGCFSVQETKWAVRQYFRVQMKQPGNTNKFEQSKISKIKNVADDLTQQVIEASTDVELRANELPEAFSHFMALLRLYKCLKPPVYENQRC